MARERKTAGQGCGCKCDEGVSWFEEVQSVIRFLICQRHTNLIFWHRDTLASVLLISSSDRFYFLRQC